MKEYTIGIEATVYDEVRVMANSQEEAFALADEVVRMENYDHYDLCIVDVSDE